jgi:hypothetical protein
LKRKLTRVEIEYRGNGFGAGGKYAGKDDGLNDFHVEITVVSFTVKVIVVL